MSAQQQHVITTCRHHWWHSSKSLIPIVIIVDNTTPPCDCMMFATFHHRIQTYTPQTHPVRLVKLMKFYQSRRFTRSVWSMKSRNDDFIWSVRKHQWRIIRLFLNQSDGFRDTIYFWISLDILNSIDFRIPMIDSKFFAWSKKVTHSNFSMIERNFPENESLCDFEQGTSTYVFGSVLLPRLWWDFEFCDCYEDSI